LDFSDINPIKALYWSAVVNGVLAPFLLLGILMVIRDRTIMKNQPTSLAGQLVVATTTILMFGAAIGMFVFG
jgi:Mn2+/Fe2+ NRAMP family transporter